MTAGHLETLEHPRNSMEGFQPSLIQLYTIETSIKARELEIVAAVKAEAEAEIKVEIKAGIHMKAVMEAMMKVP